MNIPSKPKPYKKLPHFKGLPNFGALEILRDHIKEIQTEVTQSFEHTLSIISYAKLNQLKDIVRLKAARKTKVFEPGAFNPSAFDEGTIQDLKYHKEAHEVYFLLAGRLKILWKKNNDASFKHNLILDKEKPYAFIPSGHCLLIASERVGAFLAIAFKTKKSTIDKGGKVLSEKCPHYKSVQCDIRESCEHLRANRSSFFEAVSVLRSTAVTNAKSIARDVAP